MSIERDDFGAGRNDPYFFPMPALTEPAGEARDDYVIFAALEERLSLGQAFTEGRTVRQWLEHLYSDWRQRLAVRGYTVPAFDEFWKSEYIKIPVTDPGQVLHAEYRADPLKHPLPTPSGRIEIFSESIDSFRYEDCPGHPVWLEPREWLGQADRRYPLHLISNQPKTRLHSQLDVGAVSKQSKIQGREPARMNPADAAVRGLRTGDVVRIRNDRGSCLTGLIVSEALRPGVVQLSTGAWYDPTRRIRPSVVTATPTCLPRTSLPQAFLRAPQPSTRWWRSSAGIAHSRPSPSTNRRGSSSAALTL